MKDKTLVFLRICCAFLLLGLSSGLLAQPQTVQGRITDAATGDPIPGANIIVQGTTIGTVSNLDGEFTLEADGADAILAESLIALEELVVIGYGTQKKSDLTGAVSVVNTDNIEKIHSNDISKVLQGQASGVTVHGSGEPGSDPRIKIRGIIEITTLIIRKMA